MADITQCWSMESWFQQVRITNIKYPKVVQGGSTFNMEIKVEDNSLFGCIPIDRWFKVQIKDLTTNTYIWESLPFKICKSEYVVIPLSLVMGNSNSVLNIEVCHEKDAAPNTLQDRKEIRIEVATSTKPPTPPTNEIPETKTGEKPTDWTQTILIAVGILAAAYLASSFIGGKK